MVEDQQGIKAVLSFGAKSMDPMILEQLLVGREKNAEHLFKAINGIVNHANNQQILVIGQRGMGKTHLIRLLFHRCQPFIHKKQLVVAYFSEEEYGVSSYFDFLTRMLFAFIRWYEEDRDYLNEELERLQNTSEVNQVSFLEDILHKYVADKPLLILAENFGDILNAIGPNGQAKLRAWMYKNDRANIIATSQSISDDFDREDKPFYGFFQLYYLKPLSFEGTLEFLISLAKIEEREDVIEHLKNKGKAQVKAIYDLVKGNHRLIVTFYEFLKSDMLARLSNHFIKTINDLKPYYETYIRYLPAQQQKILRFIALARKPQQGTVISKNCFIDQKSLSKQLSELVRKKLVEAIPDQHDKRNKLYDINEPLLRISIEVGEHKEGITALFVDFLALYYEENELTDKKMRFTDLLGRCSNFFDKVNFQYEIDAIERALYIKNSTDASDKAFARVLVQLDGIGLAAGLEILEKNKAKINKEDHDFLMAFVYLSTKKLNEAAALYSQFSDAYLRERDGYPLWGHCLFQLAMLDVNNTISLLEQCVDKYRKAIKPDDLGDFYYQEMGNAMYMLSIVRGDVQLLLESQEVMEKALFFDPDVGSVYRDLAGIQVNAAIFTHDSDYCETAAATIKAGLELNQNNKSLLHLWGISISILSDRFEGDCMDFNAFKASLSQLTVEDRIECWKNFSGLNNRRFLFEMLPVLESDLIVTQDELEAITIEWISCILRSTGGELRVDELAALRSFISEFINKIPELEISRRYLDTCEAYFLKGDRNAIYDLPKEQRIFFQKKILGEEPDPDLTEGRTPGAAPASA